jgi:hypothetical protein
MFISILTLFVKKAIKESLPRLKPQMRFMAQRTGRLLSGKENAGSVLQKNLTSERKCVLEASPIEHRETVSLGGLRRASFRRFLLRLIQFTSWIESLGSSVGGRQHILR